MTEKSNYDALYQKLNLKQQAKINDIHALTLLKPLLINYPYLPFTKASLRPDCLAHISNDIILNNRQNIIEFGSGLSTLILGRLIKKNRLSVKLLSIDNNKEWIKTMNNLLRNEHLNDVITLKWVPLTTCELAIDNNEWYDIKKLTDYTRNKKFDMVIIDGPVAWEPGKQMARYPALPFMIDKINKKFSLYLDDTNRVGEQSIIEIWRDKYGIDLNFSDKSFAYHYGGDSFYTEI